MVEVDSLLDGSFGGIRRLDPVGPGIFSGMMTCLPLEFLKMMVSPASQRFQTARNHRQVWDDSEGR